MTTLIKRFCFWITLTTCCLIAICEYNELFYVFDANPLPTKSSTRILLGINVGFILGFGMAIDPMSYPSVIFTAQFFLLYFSFGINIPTFFLSFFLGRITYLAWYEQS